MLPVPHRGCRPPGTNRSPCSSHSRAADASGSRTASTTWSRRYADATGISPLAELSLQVCDHRDTPCRRLLLEDRHELPAVLAEVVQDLAGVVLEQRRNEILPLHPSGPPIASISR